MVKNRLRINRKIRDPGGRKSANVFQFSLLTNAGKRKTKREEREIALMTVVAQ
jgi:hypothetical protein